MSNWFKGLFSYEETTQDKPNAEKAPLITPEKIIKHWDGDVCGIVQNMGIVETLFINDQIGYWFNSNILTIKKKKPVEWCENLVKYLENISIEGKANFFILLSQKNQQRQEWPKEILRLHKSLGEAYISFMREP